MHIIIALWSISFLVLVFFVDSVETTKLTSGQLCTGGLLDDVSIWVELISKFSRGQRGRPGQVNVGRRMTEIPVASGKAGSQVG
jgi:hypothetical protein